MAFVYSQLADKLSAKRSQSPPKTAQMAFERTLLNKHRAPSCCSVPQPTVHTSHPKSLDLPEALQATTTTPPPHPTPIPPSTMFIFLLCPLPIFGCGVGTFSPGWSPRALQCPPGPLCPPHCPPEPSQHSALPLASQFSALLASQCQGHDLVLFCTTVGLSLTLSWEQNMEKMARKGVSPRTLYPSTSSMLHWAASQ